MNQKNRVFLAVLFIFLVLVIGVFGYMILEDYSFVDAFYMTIITVTTVGFGEVAPLENSGKIFTALLCVAGIGAVTYSVTTIATFLFDKQVNRLLTSNRFRKTKKMKNHVIICGYGRIGNQAAQELIAHNEKVMIIEKRENVITQHIQKNIDYVKGDATDDNVLNKAGVLEAKAVISAFPNDADNLFVVISAKALNKNLIVVSRASSQVAERKLRIAGADKVILPEKLGGTHMANLVAHSDIIEFMDVLSIHGESPTVLEEISCQTGLLSIAGNTIHELGIRRKSGANIIGFKTPDGQYIINPTPDTKIIPYSKLFVLGTPKQINEMKRLLQ